jgi:hypothetical protein
VCFIILFSEVAVEATAESVYAKEVSGHPDHASAFVVFNGVENVTFQLWIAHRVSCAEGISNKHFLQCVDNELLVQAVAGLNLAL